MKIISPPIPVEKLWFPLVKKFYQAYYPSGKPNKSEPMWVIKNGSIIIAAVRIKPLPSCQLLTALVTHPDYRHQGYASQLMDHLQGNLSNQASYCFSLPALVGFYHKHGFVNIQPTDLPEELAGRLRRYRVQQPTLQAMHYRPSK